MHLQVVLFVALTVPNWILCQFSQRSNIGQYVDVAQYTTELINNLLPANYNKNLRPDYGGQPCNVNVSILVTDISGISETTMDFKVDIFIRHYWREPRLSFAVQHNIEQVTLGEEFLKKIWLPDTFFENSKELNAHQTVTSESTTLFRIKHNGDMTYSTRVSITARCPMDLTFYPVDRQKCSLEISSYGLVVEELVYHWVDDPSAVSFHPEIYLPAFHLLGYSKHRLTQPYTTGNYSRLQVDFYLSRSIGYYVSQIFVPTFLVVIISWVPFWLDRDDHHARVALGVTTVLTMTTLVTSSNSDFPKISHIKAIDVYLFAAFLMVFFALLEYAIVGYYELRCRKRHQTKALPLKDASAIDGWSRRIFPAFFVLFNLIYFSGLYLTVIFYMNHPPKHMVKL